MAGVRTPCLPVHPHGLLTKCQKLDHNVNRESSDRPALNPASGSLHLLAHLDKVWSTEPGFMTGRNCFLKKQKSHIFYGTAAETDMWGRCCSASCENVSVETRAEGDGHLPTASSWSAWPSRLPPVPLLSPGDAIK